MPITSPNDLRAARHERRLSRSELARLSGVDRRDIAAIERADHVFTAIENALDGNPLTCAACGRALDS